MTYFQDGPMYWLKELPDMGLQPAAVYNTGKWVIGGY
jgi:hypothetical protein